MIHGVLNVYKEKGYTSHDVVAKLRGIVKQKKIGHTGTLDPDAEGVLPVCFGKATKLCDLLTDKDKTYQAVLLLGQVTDTQDTSGQVLEKHSTEDLTNEKVENVIRSFEGEYDQIPPMYSALKVNGKKLYELAREGKEVERKARRITIHEIRILEINLPEVKLEVTCSKGTYIRTLCHDIGQKLGCGGCMKELLRTRVERFGLEDSIRLGEIAQLQKEGIENILALRGDIPQDGQFPLPGQYSHACELIEDIKKMGDFCIGAACYPEGHVEMEHKKDDIRYLKEKVDCGVDFITTQMFFNNDIFYNFLYRIREQGIMIPVLPGIMPITTKKQLARSCALSGTAVPQRFRAIVDYFGDDPAAMKQAGIAYATDQIIDLIANGVRNIHVYSMNKPEVAAAIMQNLSEIVK